MKIRIAFDDAVILATLNDNETSRDLASLLPLTLTLEDYASTEKIATLPKRLATASASPGYKPLAGDVTYYAPWGNLAIFHKDFSYSPGLIKLGTLDADVEAFRRLGPLKSHLCLIND